MFWFSVLCMLIIPYLWHVFQSTCFLYFPWVNGSINLDIRAVSLLSVHITSSGHCILPDLVGLWVLLTRSGQRVNIFIPASPVRSFLAISLAPFGTLSCRQQICFFQKYGRYYVSSCVVDPSDGCELFPVVTFQEMFFHPFPVFYPFFFKEKWQSVNGTKVL